MWVKESETNIQIKKYTGLSDERINELRKLLNDNK